MKWLVVFVAFIALGVTCRWGKINLLAEEVKTLAIGEPAPDFSLPSIDGQSYRLIDFDQAKLLLVIFTCNHCPTAQAYEDRIIAIHSDYQDRGVAVVAISPNDPLAVRLDELGYTDLGDSMDDMKQRAQDRGFKFPYLYDGETQQTSKAFGVLATPHVFLFDQDRKLRYAGRIDDNDIQPPTSHDLRNALDELLVGQPVTLPETPVFGCSTKWSDKREAAAKTLEKWNQEGAELHLLSPADLRQRLSEPSENYRLVNVWATWCIPCIEELDELVTIHRMYRKRQFELITISADDPSQQQEALNILQDKHCSASNYLLDARNRDDLFDSVDPDWKGAVPYTALISPSGKVVHRIHGEIEPAELKRVIADHLGRTYASRKK
jgi:peroxiredoxin